MKYSNTSGGGVHRLGFLGKRQAHKPIQHFDDFEQLAPVCGGVHGNENISKAVDGFHIAACRHPDHFCERLRDCSGDKVDFVLTDFAGRGYNTFVK